MYTGLDTRLHRKHFSLLWINENRFSLHFVPLSVKLALIFQNAISWMPKHYRATLSQQTPCTLRETRARQSNLSCNQLAPKMSLLQKIIKNNPPPKTPLHLHTSSSCNYYFFWVPVCSRWHPISKILLPFSFAQAKLKLRHNIDRTESLIANIATAAPAAQVVS